MWPRGTPLALLQAFVWVGTRSSTASRSSDCSSDATSTSVVTSAADLAHGGVCPASELSCPRCPAQAPIKCPQGLCTANVRECTPNIYIRGALPLPYLAPLRRRPGHALALSQVTAMPRTATASSTATCSRGSAMRAGVRDPARSMAVAPRMLLRPFCIPLLRRALPVNGDGIDDF